MSQSKGCNFCRRNGLALLPVRAGIKGIEDSAPNFPSSFTAPTVPAQGETAYTTRLLREGFLYIWNEQAGSWINYFTTQEGFYYPLPEEGSVPPAVASGKTRPCITEPTELAGASLITLPVLPPPYKNGAYWFAWSEVEWTDAVRKKHEDAGYRAQYMQRFDMDGWVNGGKAENVTSISGLSTTVAEYSVSAGSSEIPQWTPLYWKSVFSPEGENLIMAAESLSPGKGGIILLEDPVAITQEISSLCNWRLDQNFGNNPKYKRGLALSSALSGLHDAMCTQFERDLLAQNEKIENQVRYGWETTGGIMIPSQPSRAKDLQVLNDQVLKSTVAERWSPYEKYIDRAQQNAFLDGFKKALEAYDQRVVSPMVVMYLGWLKSQNLLDYLNHNFDPEDVASGGVFIQAMLDCVGGMQDKKGVSEYFTEQLAQVSITATNILLRATVMNNTAWAQQINSALSSNRYDDLPWDKLADGFKDIAGHLKESIHLVMETYLSTISSVLLAVARQSVNGVLMPALVALASSTGHALKTVSLTGERKYFVKAVLEQLAGLTDQEDRVAKDRLRHYIDIEMRRMNISGAAVDGQQQSRFIVMIDADEAKQLASTPLEGRAQAAARTIHSVEEINESVFPKYWRDKLSIAKGMSTHRLASDATTSIPFAGCTLSMALQWNAVISGGGLDGYEGVSKFVANIVSSIGASAEVLNNIWRNFRSIRLRGIVRIQLGAGVERFISTTLRRVMRIGAAAGVVAVLWDVAHVFTSFEAGEISSGIAYLASAIGGSFLWVAAMGWLTLGPLGIIICLILVFGAAIFLASKEKDEIQKWLAAMWWRHIPADDKDIPAIMPETAEMDSFNKLMQQGGATA
ncbi:T6SS effector BTH_I2691 family protein [Scandinavium sp. NPDC088450]|uniref:T6SS effector BTH_I2691 family protein n=1 Tax=Scandinavium sp. NPDC088450 TaxID=3364514 RepID=UPI00384E0BDF